MRCEPVCVTPGAPHLRYNIHLLLIVVSRPNYAPGARPAEVIFLGRLESLAHRLQQDPLLRQLRYPSGDEVDEEAKEVEEASLSGQFKPDV